VKESSGQNRPSVVESMASSNYSTGKEVEEVESKDTTRPSTTQKAGNRKTAARIKRAVPFNHSS